MISSTKPSKPMKAFKRLAPSTRVNRRAAQCSRNSSSSIEVRRRVLVRGDADDLQDALQIVVVEEADFERAFALFVTQLHFGSEPLSQPILQVGNVRRRCRGGAVAVPRFRRG